MNILVNVDGSGNGLTNLLSKLADSAGWIANKETPKKSAIDTYIKDIQESNYDPALKAALISNAKKIIKEYCNQNDIVQIALQNLQESANSQKIEDDWLEQFMVKAGRISSKEFQWIWGKILARECNNPGSIPLALLYTLERMDKDDAETFTTLCRLSVKLEGGYSPVIIRKRFSDYKQFGINFDKLVNLGALGLIEMSLDPLSSEYALKYEKDPAKVIYYGKEREFSGKKAIRIGNVIYTKSGEALCQSLDVEEIEGFWEKYCLPFWEENK